jgi:small-conductance mechanosensitive channel
MMDPPFEVGDYVELDIGKAGRVQDIGLRTTRVWTMDDVELVLPNSMMTSRLVTNVSRGSKRSERLRVNLTLRYDENMDLQMELLRAACEVEGVLQEPTPQVRLLKLGDFGLEYVINVWIEHSELREPVVDRINQSALRALNAGGMDVPFPRYEVSVTHEDSKPSD